MSATDCLTAEERQGYEELLAAGGLGGARTGDMPGGSPVEHRLGNTDARLEEARRDLCLSVDYVTATVKEGPKWLGDLMGQVGGYSEGWGAFECRGAHSGSLGYRYVTKGPGGATIFHGVSGVATGEDGDALDGEGGREPGVRSTLQVGGEALGPMGVVGQLDLIRAVLMRGGTISRLDLAVDYCDFKPGVVLKAFREGRVKSTANRESWLGLVSGKGGDTAYIGSRKSARFLRVYRKRDAEGNWFTRLELELKRGKAKEAAFLLDAAGVEGFAGVSLSIIRGYVDFPTRWWKRLMGSTPVLARQRRQIAEVSLIRAEDWVERSVAPTLAAIYKAYGNSDEKILLMIWSGLKRMNAKQRLIAGARS